MVVVQVAGGEGSQGLVVQGVGRGGSGLDDIALVELELHFSGHVLLGHIHKCLDGLAQRGEPFSFVYDLGELVAQVLFRLHGGAVENELLQLAGQTLDVGEVVELVNIGGKETLAYKTFKIDACVIRAYASDETGNLSVEHSAIGDTGFDIAAATHNSGGIVIAEVKTVVKDGTLDPHRVKIPASLVDYVVVADEGMYSQGYAADFRPELSGEIRVPVDGLKPMAMSNRKIIARRGAMELTKGCVINLGIGIPSGIGSVAGEEGISATLSVEYGALGGVPVEGVGFGAAANPEAILDVSDVFQLYDGGFLSKTFLGFAEADMNGNVNSSKFGTRVTGPGGFIDISQNTKEVCFVGTFTAGGLKEEVRDGKLVILQEGRERKFLNKVQQVTFSGDYANEQGQKIMFITERAVFQLTADGLVLTEIAPGVDLEKDILSQMDFKPIISRDLKLMDEAIFKDEPMGLSRLLSVVPDNDADEKTA